ncbi:MAG: hypothetical protein QGG40_00230 [Myxococcota bacterium]|nr:hypothetical protein [Myxococcota bacterium]
MTLLLRSAALLALTLGSGELHAEPSPVAIDTWRDELRVLTDDDGHFLTLVPFGARDALFYGDGKTFHQLRSSGSSRTGDEKFSYTLWDPRHEIQDDPTVRFEQGAYTVTCEDREQSFRLLSPEETDRTLKKAEFLGPLWERQAVFFARDDYGTYYYIDRIRDDAPSYASRGTQPLRGKSAEPTGPDFHVYAGWRGQMMRAPLVPIAIDSAGWVFSTPTGDRRLILTDDVARWVDEDRDRTLAILPLQQNYQLIYNEKGVYPGRRFGTPCDDI